MSSGIAARRSDAAVPDQATGIEHIGIIGDLQRLGRVLFDHKDREVLLPEAFIGIVTKVDIFADDALGLRVAKIEWLR